jgi:hypothetical protein
MILETKIEVEVCVLAYDYLGITNVKLKVPGQTGNPDRLFWLPHGKPLLIEFKLPGEKPELKQLHVHRHLQELGYDVQVHDNAADAFQAIIDAVAPACVSKASGKILARARRRCALLRSRARQD